MVVVVAAVAAAPADKDDPSAKDLKGLQGTWQMEKGVRGGAEAPADQVAKMKLVVSGNNFSLGDSSRADKAVVELDASNTPASIDLKRGERTVKGIYLLEGDTLKLCLGRPGTDRPKEFVSKAGSETALMVFKRVKK
jgi:uncharacterized protein (TIGR03067 family)